MSGASVVVRRFSGPEAEELFALVRAQGSGADVGRQAESAYRAVADMLAAEGASSDALACDTIFLRDSRRDLQTVLDARGRVFDEAGRRACRPLTAFVEQPPLIDEAPFEISMSALIPRRGATTCPSRLQDPASCDCAVCLRTSVRVRRVADQTCFATGSVHGSGATPVAEAYDMFGCAEHLLAQAGMSFANVVRTWIYLRDIDRDYEALNQARRDFFRQRGIHVLPASTAVGGALSPDGHVVSMRLYAVESSRPLEIGVMSCPSLNEAWDYGADFSRGLRVVEANKLALYVSGTASVDEGGRTVHPADFASQAERMLVNLSSLLVEQGAGFQDVLSAVTYLKRRRDVASLTAIFRARGFEGFPIALVEAPLCRPDLLCETELVAALPLPRAAA